MNRMSVMKKDFSANPVPRVGRSMFDRSFSHTTTLNEGLLIPIYRDFAVPGDTFKMDCTLYCRLFSPMKRPIMDNIYMDIHFFSVDVQELWKNWKYFLGAWDNIVDPTEYEIPYVGWNADGVDVMEIYDYIGVPPIADCTGFQMNALFLRAYNKIWNEWYRSPLLQERAYEFDDDGPDSSLEYWLLPRGKRHDYITSCLPYPQLGDAMVDLPLGTTAPVIGNGMAIGLYDGLNARIGMTVLDDGNRQDVQAAQGAYSDAIGTAEAEETQGIRNVALGLTNEAAYSGMITDLSTATAATINDLRLAVATQQFLERDARYGNRIAEIIYSHYGVRSADHRLHRPEYLGGGSFRINVNPVTQQSSSSGSEYSGNQTAYAVGVGFNNGFVKTFTEHSIVMGLCSIRADLRYQQGVDKMLTWKTKYDIPWPEFSNLGEEEVLNREIFWQNNATDLLTFGYQERYVHEKQMMSMITGKLRSDVAGTLESYHLAEDFAALPTLDEDFIKETPPIERVVQITTEPHFILDAFFKYHCARPFPVFSIPGLSKVL